MTYSVWSVDPGTLGDMEQLTTVESCSITNDMDDACIVSASIGMDYDPGVECVRVYAGDNRTIPLATLRVSSNGHEYSGVRQSETKDGYGLLIDLTRQQPPIGYSIGADVNALEAIASIIEQHSYADVVRDFGSKHLQQDFVAEPDETWMDFIGAALDQLNMRIVDNKDGSMSFAQRGYMDIVQHFRSGDGSMLLGCSVEDDAFDAPDGVEVVLSSDNGTISARSGYFGKGAYTVRETSPDVPDGASKAQLQRCADSMLADLGKRKRTVVISHPVQQGVDVGKYAAVDYDGLDGVGMIISQSIECGVFNRVQSTIELEVE